MLDFSSFEGLLHRDLQGVDSSRLLRERENILSGTFGAPGPLSRKSDPDSRLDYFDDRSNGGEIPCMTRLCA